MGNRHKHTKQFDGLTIEGVGIREDGYGVTSWSGNGALFDINGHNGTVIRNLVSVNSSTTFAGKSTVTATGTHGATPGSIEVYTHEPVPAAYIKITAAANVIALQSGVADTVQLTATTYGHAPETYTWVSADAGIATVDGIGLVTSAAGSGRVVISAIGNTTGVIGEFLIQVWTGAMGHIVVVGGQFIVRDGDTATVIAQTINGAADASYAWVSSYLPAVTVTTPGATTTATGHAEQPRCMITNTGSPAIGCVIEHCLAITEPGATHQHGLLYVPSSSGLIGSRITDCFASTSAFGVFIEGVAAQLDITDNWIQCSSTYPARDGGFRLPHVGGGIVVDSASVLGLYIHNNHVQDFGGFFISPLYDTSYDVYSSQAAFIQNNVLTGNTPWVKSGISSVVTNNSLSGTGLTKIDVDAGGTTPSLCTVAGNTVTSSGHLGTIDSGIGTTLSDNKTDLITLNSNCRATGNYLYYGFGFPMGSVTAVQIVGNNLGNPAGFSISAASSSLYDSVIDGNTMAGAISIGGGNYTVANNIVELGMTLGGASTVTGNQVTGAVLFDCGTAGAVVTGNMFGNNVTFSTASTACENVRFGDNTVLGGLGMADGGGGNVQMKHTVTGNDIVGAANIDASDSTITGNKFRGAVTIGTTTARADDTVAGNRIEGALTVGVGCMVTGNIGNSTTDITVSAGCTVIGNTFRNLLPVMGDPEPGGGKTPVLGNRILGSRFGVAGPFVGDYLGNQS